jgi:hypothetical protein
MKKYIAVAVLMLGATLASAQMLHVTSLNHEDFSNVPQDDCSRNLCKTYVDTVKGYVILNKDTVRRLTLQCKAWFLLGEKSRIIAHAQCWNLSAGEDVSLKMLLDGKQTDDGSVSAYTILKDVECPNGYWGKDTRSEECK